MQYVGIYKSRKMMSKLELFVWQSTQRIGGRHWTNGLLKIKELVCGQALKSYGVLPTVLSACMCVPM